MGSVEIQTDMKHALLWELHAITVENQTTTPNCASESHKSQQVEAKETKNTALEATDLTENTKIQENLNVAFMMHVMTGKEPTGLGQDPQEEQNISSTKIKATITAKQMKAMTAPQIAMMNATCNT